MVQYLNLLLKSIPEIEAKRLGFWTREISRIAEFAKIKELTAAVLSLFPRSSIIEDKRVVKDAQEIEKLKQATKITALALEHIKKFIACGINEIEVAAEFERFIRYHGCNASSFDTIVASGPNSTNRTTFPGREIKR